jgi:hypothetical protein
LLARHAVVAFTIVLCPNSVHSSPWYKFYAKVRTEREGRARKEELDKWMRERESGRGRGRGGGGGEERKREYSWYMFDG